MSDDRELVFDEFVLEQKTYATQLMFSSEELRAVPLDQLEAQVLSSLSFAVERELFVPLRSTMRSEWVHRVSVRGFQMPADELYAEYKDRDLQPSPHLRILRARRT